MNATGRAIGMVALLMATPGSTATRETIPVAAGYDVPASFNDVARGGSTYHITVLFPSTTVPLSLNLHLGGQIRYWQNVGVYREFDTLLSINRDLCAAGGCQLFSDRVVAQVTLPGPEQPTGPECADQMMVQCRFSYGPFHVQLDHGYESSAAGQLRVQAYSGGVPDVASWSTMLLGLGAVGSIARRRQRQAALGQSAR